MGNTFLITISTLISLLFSCKSQEDITKEANYTKLITVFDPSFDETSEITFIDSGSSKKLTIMIKRDLFRNLTPDGLMDTFYYKEVSLTDNQALQIKDSILINWDTNWKPKNIVATDGISIRSTYIDHGDTMEITYHSPSKSDIIPYKLTIAKINAYNGFLQDSVINSYFQIIRTYLDNQENPKSVVPYRRLQEKKYPGQIRYTTPTN